MFLLCGLLVPPAFAETETTDEITSFKVQFRLCQSAEDGEVKVVAKPLLPTLVNHSVAFVVGSPIEPGEDLLRESRVELGKVSINVSILVPEIKDNLAQVQVESRIGTMIRGENDQDQVQHRTSVVRSHFQAKVNELKKISLDKNQWLEVTITDVKSYPAPQSSQKPAEENVKSKNATVRMMLIDQGPDRSIHTKMFHTTFDVTKPFELEGPKTAVSGKNSGVGTFTMSYTGQFKEVAAGQADVAFTVQLDEDLRNESEEATRRTTEHRFTYRAQAGKKKTFKISEQQRVELTFTWDE
jgi:hypothetical protein